MAGKGLLVVQLTRGGHFDFLLVKDGLTHTVLAPVQEKISSYFLIVYSVLSTVLSACGCQLCITLYWYTVALYLTDRFGDLGLFIGHLLKMIFYTIENLLCMARLALTMKLVIAIRIVCPSHLGLWSSKTQRPYVVSAAIVASIQARIHTGFHRFTEIGQNFYNNNNKKRYVYIFNKSKL